jgi:putative endonuclease
MAQHNLLGNKGEMLAARFLMDKGYAIHEYNWRSGHKEIDLIAQERDVLVFVEVKSRSSAVFGDAVDAVTPAKIKLLISAAEAYIQQREIDLDYRFDVVTVVGDGESHAIEHIEDAFAASW